MDVCSIAQVYTNWGGQSDVAICRLTAGATEKDTMSAAFSTMAGLTMALFEYWMAFAPTLSSELGLSVDTILHAHDVVCSVMGSSWLDEQAAASHRAGRSIADVHPLFRDLRGQTRGCVLEVLQLASYLCAFRDDPQLGEAIISLRDAGKYDPTILEFDLAWKFRNAGARVRLFPPTPGGGAGDFAVAVNGREHIVEVSGFPTDSLRGNLASFLAAMDIALQSALKRTPLELPVALELDIDEVTGSVRPAAHAAILEIIRAYRNSGSDQAVSRTHEFGSVLVRPLIPGEGPTVDKWTMAVRTARARLAPSKLFGATNYDDREPGNWIYLHDRSADADPYIRLRSKLKREACQLSGCIDAVIVIDVEGLGFDAVADPDRLAEVLREFSRNHRSTTGVAIIVRPEKVSGLRGIAGDYFALAENALGANFWRMLLDADHNSNVFRELTSVVT